jgi:hypothetical protein
MAEEAQVSTLRRILRPVVRGTLQSIRSAREEARAFTAGLRHGLAGRIAAGLGLRRAEPALQQAILSFATPLPALPGYEELRAELGRRGLRFCEGAWTLYIPPQAGLRELLGPVVDRYPADAGWKILKDFARAESASYIPRDRSAWQEPSVSTYADTLLAGTSRDQLQRATVLHLYGIGPRAYDVVTLTAGESALTAFVVKHVAGSVPTADEFRGLLDRIDRRLASRELALPHLDWRQHKDFLPPDCNGNAIRDADTGEVLYVDSQGFLAPERKTLVAAVLKGNARSELHFGEERVTRGGRYLYQSIPDVLEGGKRDTGTRWELITDLLGRAGVGLAERPVYDVGCNAGMMLAYALSAGASWGVGWDRPAVIHHARELLIALGFTRVDLHSAALVPDYPLIDDVPEHVRRGASEGVVFYLAMVKHIGFLNGLAALPWRVMVYEGNEIERLATLDEHLAALRPLCRFRVAEAVDYTDGEGRPRPLAILVRD